MIKVERWKELAGPVSSWCTAELCLVSDIHAQVSLVQGMHSCRPSRRVSAQASLSMVRTLSARSIRDYSAKQLE